MRCSVLGSDHDLAVGHGSRIVDCGGYFYLEGPTIFSEIGGRTRLNPADDLLIAGDVFLFGSAKTTIRVHFYEGTRELGESEHRLDNRIALHRVRVPDGTDSARFFLRIGRGSFGLAGLSIKQDGGFARFLTSDRRIAMFVISEVKHDHRVKKTARTLIDAGYGVVVFGMHRHGSVNLSFAEMDGIPTILFPDPRRHLPLKKTSASANWEYRIVALKLAMWPYVEFFRPTHIHTHDFDTVDIGAEFVDRLKQSGRAVHWVHDIHDYAQGYDHWPEDMTSLFERHEKRSMASVDHVFTVSPPISQWVQSRYGLPTAPTVLMNVPVVGRINAMDRSIRRDVGLDDRADLFVYSGSVFGYKDIATVLTAVATFDSCHLALLTNNRNDHVSELIESSRELGCADRFHTLDYVGSYDIIAYLRDASAGVMAFGHHANVEAALPNKLFDYLHADLPMLSSDNQLLVDFIGKWEIGEIYESGNVDSCRNAIARLLENKDRYVANMRSNDALKESHSWEKQSELLLEAYARLDAGDPAHTVPAGLQRLSDLP